MREQIAGHRDELMALLRDGGLDEGPQASVIEPADRSQVLPLSFAQQRLWFLWQLDPTSVEYNLPIPIKWDEEFDLTAMTSALTAWWSGTRCCAPGWSTARTTPPAR